MKLLLTSNGFTKTLGDTFLSLLNKLPKQNSVAFVTTAAFGEEETDDWKQIPWLEEYRNQLRDLGLNNLEDIDLKNKTNEELEHLIASKDVIFVNGGNTFYLMYWIKKSGFDRIVKNFLDHGGLYVGVSAGSIVMCPTIESASWMPPDKNIIGLADFSGLSYVNFLIHPHFDPERIEEFRSEIRSANYPVVALTNDQGIIAADGKVQIIGGSQKYSFNGFLET